MSRDGVQGKGWRLSPFPWPSAGETQRREPLLASCGTLPQLAEQIALGLLHGHGGVGVGMRRRLTLECVGVGVEAQGGLPIREAAQDLPGRLPLPVDALDLASGKRAKLGDAAGPVEVQVWIQMLAMKLIDGVGMLAGDVRPAERLADHRPILGLHQGIVAGMTRPRLGLLDEEFVQ